MNWLARTRRRTHEVLEVAAEGDELSRVIDVSIIFLVALNIVAVVLNSVESLAQRYAAHFAVFELISVIVFSAEFALRVWIAAERTDRGSTVTRRRARYIFSPMALADLAAIAPFYLQAFFALDLRFLRMLRLLRILKLTRYSGALADFVDVMNSQKGPFATAFALLLVVMVFTSSAMYLIEHEAQPEAFASIPAAMWWAVCTLTTVGYGDVTPVTSLGKLVASAITLIGIGMVALPTSILASGFLDLQASKRRQMEAEAHRALADGVVTEDEALAYSELAERLGVDEDDAQEIISLAAQHLETLRPADDCPHCGKELG